MAEPFLSEIRLVSFGFPPKGWAMCDGQLLPINQNQALFSLLGTTFGGNGQSTFALPDLRGRIPCHAGVGGGQSLTLGERGGANAVLVGAPDASKMGHAMTTVRRRAEESDPTGRVLGVAEEQIYGHPAAGSLVAMGGTVDDWTGGGQAHENRMPSLTLSFVIALQGIFPSPN